LRVDDSNGNDQGEYRCDEVEGIDNDIDDSHEYEADNDSESYLSVLRNCW
jgi:hypothetical protein